MFHCQFVTSIVPYWNVCLAMASWYVSFGDANDCRGELAGCRHHLYQVCLVLGVSSTLCECLL